MSNTNVGNHDFEQGAGSATKSAQQRSRAPSDGTKTGRQPAASEIADEAVDRAKEMASATASTVGREAKRLLNRQIGTGANMVGQVGRSVKRAAEDLESDAPQLAGFARAVADHIDDYAVNLRGQSVDQLYRSTSEFTRRKPALVFGLAAVGGFLALRILKSEPSGGGRSNPTSYPGHGDGF